MTARDFLNPVDDLLATARAELAGKPVSDLVDAAGRQYVDLVLGGPGLIGLPLVGFAYALEELGVRFRRLVGMSAGAVPVVALAALGPPAERKAARLVGDLAKLDVWTFVDGNAAARALVRDFLAGRSGPRPAADVDRDYETFAARRGLNPGRAFRDWLAGVLRLAGVTTARHLRERLAERPPGLRHRDGRPLADADARLKVVAADLTAEARAVFPDMAPLYWADPDGVNPADFARASASVPFFFEPARVTGGPRGECAFIDGAALSNLPIDLCDDPGGPPAAPAVGAKLGVEAQPVPHFDPVVQHTAAVFHAARQAQDAVFLARRPGALVTVIDAGPQNWLNLDLTPDDRAGLFQRGAEAAVRFLRGFDWPRYRELWAAGPPARGVSDG